MPTIESAPWKRLLQSIQLAHYPEDNTELIISIDQGNSNQNIVDIANSFIWKYGKKTVVYQQKNLGLRNHILKCGGYSLSYGSVILLEDDLYVSPYYYQYATEALKFSESNDNIGGVSLYNHQLNVHTRKITFEDGYDNWYFQFASSWGQAWSSKQWSEFTDWYNSNPTLKTITNLPKSVKSWSEKSWLKYNIAYLIITDKYFMYPRVSLTTNFSDAGTHMGGDSTIYQVPLLRNKIGMFKFSSTTESECFYDAFYENITLFNDLGLAKDKLTIDLQGYGKRFNYQFYLTSKNWIIKFTSICQS